MLYLNEICGNSHQTERKFLAAFMRTVKDLQLLPNLHTKISALCWYVSVTHLIPGIFVFHFEIKKNN